MRYLVTGATGLIGRELVLQMLSAGHSVTVVTRNRRKASNLLGGEVEVVEWSDLEGLRSSLDGCHGVVHLAGEPIADRRWSKNQKKRLWDSRVETTKTLVSEMQRCAFPPVAMVSASAVGFLW